MTQNRVRKIGIVGFGSIGQKHYRVIKQLRPDTEIHLVRPISTDRPVWIDKTTKVFRNTEQLISEGIDAAIVSTPSPMHLENTAPLISSGIPVLVEKPLTNDLESAFAMKRLSESFPRTSMMLGYVLRHSSITRRIRELLATQLIGRILFVDIECGSYLPNWRTDKAYESSVSSSKATGGGVLLELSHEIDYANWLFGEFETVYAKLINTGSLRLDVEDLAELLLTTREGVTVRIHLDFCRRETVRRCTVCGINGSVTGNFISSEVTVSLPGKDPKSEIYDDDSKLMYSEQLNHFLACIESNVLPVAGTTEGIQALKVIHAAMESEKTGSLVSI